MLITTVAVAILQSPDPSRGRCDRIVDHLGDVEPPVLVPGDRHRAGDLGLGGHQLDREGRVGQLECRQLVARRSRTRGRRPCRSRCQQRSRQREQARHRHTIEDTKAMSLYKYMHCSPMSTSIPMPAFSGAFQSITSARKPISGTQSGQERHLGIGAGLVDPAADRLLSECGRSPGEEAQHARDLPHSSAPTTPG